MKTKILGLLAVGLLAGLSSHAETIALEGSASGQYSTATGVFEFNAQTNTFTFTVTNTSSITQPGSTSTITGIGFDLPPTGNASPSGLNGFTGNQAPSLSSSFTFSDADLGAIPFFTSSVLDFGFLTGSNFSGGNVSLGLLPGESASFAVAGAAFAGFTETLIANSILLYFQNVPTQAAAGGFDVAAARGLPTPVPEPATALLLSLGLAGLGLSRRRKAV